MIKCFIEKIFLFFITLKNFMACFFLLLFFTSYVTSKCRNSHTDIFRLLSTLLAPSSLVKSSATAVLFLLTLSWSFLVVPVPALSPRSGRLKMFATSGPLLLGPRNWKPRRFVANWTTSTALLLCALRSNVVNKLTLLSLRLSRPRFGV